MICYFQMVELSQGSGVFVYPHHLQVSLKKGVERGREQRNGEKMARYLLGIFFKSKELLGKSLSAVSMTKEQLNPNIIGAITTFCVCNSRHRRGEVRMALASKVSSVCSKAKTAQRYITQMAESSRQSRESGRQMAQTADDGDQSSQPNTEHRYDIPIPGEMYDLQTGANNQFNPHYENPY